MEHAEERGSDVNTVGDETDVELWKVEDAPEDVIVTVEELGTGIAKVSEPGGAGFAGILEDGGAGVGMTKVDAATELDGESNGRERTGTFRGDGQEEEIVAGGAAEFTDAIGSGVEHAGWVVRPAIAGFRRQERAFDVPSGDGGGERRMLSAKFAKAC
jgi:hypothetical protein